MLPLLCFTGGNAERLLLGSPVISLSWRWAQQEQPPVVPALGVCTVMVRDRRGSFRAQAEFLPIPDALPNLQDHVNHVGC